MPPKGIEPEALLRQEQQAGGQDLPDCYDNERTVGTTEPTQYYDPCHEHSVRIAVKFSWLGAYFVISMLLTLYNKLILDIFCFPWLLTFLHALFTSIGTYTMMHLGYFKLSVIRRNENLAVVSFSTLFTANIALSNLSMAVVSVPFYQTMRMLCPIFTISLYQLWYGRSFSSLTYLSLVPLITGAAMTTAGEVAFTDLGFFLTILGVGLAATVVTNRFMTGSLAMLPLECLLRMSPLVALQSLACATAIGEVGAFRELITSSEASLSPHIALLIGNGLLSFMLNISSFNSNKSAGALAMTVCGNLKQCLTVVLGIFLFDVPVRAPNGVGMAVTMIGAALYSKAELGVKKSKTPKYHPVQPTAR